MSQTITIRLSNELEKDLSQITKEEKLSKSELVRTAIKKYLSIRKFRQLRRKVLPFAESQGLLTDSDIFKIIK